MTSNKLFDLIIRVCFVIFFSSTIALAKCESKDMWNVKSKQITFCNIPQKRLTISQNCLDSKENLNKCQAVLFLPKTYKITYETPIGGANKGALVCDSLKASVYIGKDANSNENCFCEFKDQSMIDCGTLAFYQSNKWPSFK